ncbi:hypothetical protein [Clostridium estertheticum]|uniref:Uncharacterized protein n=1 Tax=Clostridium estertheticum TaxID=238834 RepID=A0AA47EMF9_9CLOT|nr:hypothetical protein [Clostridium estertheticum]MBU3157661.1 hypothetical protein [Clostridium estertheticum]WAG62561.1 hypothetical protein LL038_10115 [Clostridium estertheticum]
MCSNTNLADQNINLDWLKDIAIHYDFTILEEKSDSFSKNEGCSIKCKKGSLVLKLEYKKAFNKQMAYFADMYDEENKKDIEMPYYTEMNGNIRQQKYRLYSSYLKKDVGRMIAESANHNSDSSFRITIDKWDYKRGYGFASTNAIPKIFIHITQLPSTINDKNDLIYRDFLVKGLIRTDKGFKIEEIIKEIDYNDSAAGLDPKSKDIKLDLNTITAKGVVILPEEISPYSLIDPEQYKIDSIYKKSDDSYQINISCEVDKRYSFSVTIIPPGEIAEMTKRSKGFGAISSFNEFRTSSLPYSIMNNNMSLVDKTDFYNLWQALLYYKDIIEQSDSKGAIHVQQNFGF